MEDNARKKILFVDDEPAVLGALQNILRRQRREWDMTFSVGAQAALEELAKGSFDIVVTDMRMPGMDGATLLTHVQQMQPEAARIVLSGYAEREMVVRALSVAHQFLSKPCDIDQLKHVIERACALQRTLNAPGIREVVGRAKSLPSVPALFAELTAALEKPAASAKDIARIVERDPAMCAKVLQLANSAFFGAARRLSSISQAVTYLGTEALRGLTLTAGIFNASTTLEAGLGTTLEALQTHSLETAIVARALAPEAMREDAFTAGLLHEVGRLVLASCVPEQTRAIMAQCAASGRPLHEVEREVLGTTHAEVGSYLLGVWGIPNSIVEAVAYHHECNVVRTETFDLGSVVHVADALAHEAMGRDWEGELDIERVTRAGVAGRMPEWTTLARSALGLIQQAS